VSEVQRQGQVCGVRIRVVGTGHWALGTGWLVGADRSLEGSRQQAAGSSSSSSSSSSRDAVQFCSTDPAVRTYNVQYAHYRSSSVCRELAIWSLLFALCSLLSALCSLLCALCSLLSALCSLSAVYPLLSLVSALCSVLCALCPVPCPFPPILYLYPLSLVPCPLFILYPLTSDPSSRGKPCAI